MFRSTNIVFVFIIAAFLISRISLFSESPQEWDTVNYALGVEHFWIANHQPHTPGSILYIYLARLANALVQDNIRSLLLVNLVFSLIGLVATYLIVRAIGGTRNAGNIAAFLYTANPLIWYYGIVAEIYSVEAALSALNALLLLRFMRSGRERELLIATAILGLSGGIRSNATLFLFPLWLVVILLFRMRPLRLSIVKYPLILAVALAVWLVPTVIHCGGLSKFQGLSGQTIHYSFETHSALFGASRSEHMRMLVRLAAWYFIAAGVPTISVLVLLLKRSRTWPGREHAAFLALWLVPATLFFTLILAAKPGYLLFVFPGVFVLMALVIAGHFRRPLSAWIFVILVSLPGLGYFFGPGLGADDIPSQLTGRMVPRFFRFTLNEVKYQDNRNAAFREMLKDRVDQESSIFVFSNFSTWNYRIANYFYPGVEQHQFIAFSSGKISAHTHFREGVFDQASDATIDHHSRDVFVFFHEMSSWGQDLLASGVSLMKSADGAQCFFIPAGTKEIFGFKDGEVFMR